MSTHLPPCLPCQHMSPGTIHMCTCAIFIVFLVYCMGLELLLYYGSLVANRKEFRTRIVLFNDMLLVWAHIYHHAYPANICHRGPFICLLVCFHKCFPVIAWCYGSPLVNRKEFITRKDCWITKGYSMIFFLQSQFFFKSWFSYLLLFLLIFVKQGILLYKKYTVYLPKFGKWRPWPPKRTLCFYQTLARWDPDPNKYTGVLIKFWQDGTQTQISIPVYLSNFGKMGPRPK